MTKKLEVRYQAYQKYCSYNQRQLLPSLREAAKAMTLHLSLLTNPFTFGREYNSGLISS